MTRAFAAAAVLAATCVGPAAASAAAPPLTVRGTLTPAAIHFADPVVAEVEVDFDPSLVDGSSIRVVPNFGPFAETSPPAVTRARDALRIRYRLQCSTAGCLPLKHALVLHLPRLTATGSQRGRTVAASSSWPALRVVSRLSAGATTGHIAFRHQRFLPAPAYGVSPGALAAGLIAVAAVAAVAAATLVAGAFRRRSARSPADRMTLLQRALWYTRDAATRPDPADRRRALELLAKAAEETGGARLAGEVRDAAWVATPPTPRRSTELADAVEATSERG